MNVITKIGTVSNIEYMTEQVSPAINREKLTFTLRYSDKQLVSVEYIDDRLINEVRDDLKDGDRITVIGRLDESEFFIDDDTVIRGIILIGADDAVYPRDFPKDLAYRYRQEEINMQELLKVSEQFADENDPF